MPALGDQRWVNPPPSVAHDGEVLRVVTGKQTDFWNNTFYGFRHANGHFLATAVSGDFSLTVTFSAAYATLYDQAGAMLRVDDENWLKCGVEFTDGRRHFSVVVTRDDQSDWSVMPLEGPADAPVTLRLTRHGEALRVEVEGPAGYRLARLAYLGMPASVEAGPMCCSPVGEGLEVAFSRVALEEPRPHDLHDQ